MNGTRTELSVAGESARKFTRRVLRAIRGPGNGDDVQVLDDLVAKDIRFETRLGFKLAFCFELLFGFEPMPQGPSFRSSFGHINVIGQRFNILMLL